MPPIKYPLGLSAKKNWAVDILERFRKAKAVLTEKGWVCKENLDLTNLGLVALPTILEVGGNFWCSYNKLTTLEGAPEKVGGSFWCNGNPIPPNNLFRRPLNKTVEQILKDAREPKK